MAERMILLLDLDNTILDFDMAEAAAMKKALHDSGIEATDDNLKLYSEINRHFWEQLEKGKMTREEILYGRFKAFFEEIGAKADHIAAQDTYEEYLCQGHYFVPGAEELLEALYKEHDLYIVSNGNAKVQDARLASSGISKYFKKIFISETMGCDKPSKAFFDLCFAQIPGFDPDRALIIGDSLTSDIRGGINAGIRTCWFNPKGLPARADIPADYMVTSLAEIPALVKNM